MMATGKEVREALRKARKAGMEVRRLPNSHWEVSCKGDRMQVAFSPGNSGSVQRSVRYINRFVKEHTP